MFDISELFINKNLSKEEKFKLLNSSRVNFKIIDYLTSRFNNLRIEINDQQEDRLIKLMNQDKLKNWPLESTEAAILFLNDDDYIERGNIYLAENSQEYFHSWICFKYDNKEYVLDPSFNILCKKSTYIKAFNTDVLAKVYAKGVKYAFMKKMENYEDEMIMHDQNINDPFYKNSAGYITEIKDKKIKKLKVHYY